MMTAKTKDGKREPFEKSLEKLETTVRRLEDGEGGLEESLRLFEEGVGLAKDLTARLDDVKRRVEVLIKEGPGKFKVEPLKEDE